ncbi:hypothetical protein KFE96_15620 [Kordiimonas sp. SCSIO 12603]|uniref:hypothetical protein n=1 Tax=Kordiimonas sp. SCSIO 12603 TaxID=2829596 RepID=UPI00210385AF|nr:hypothetical protein [Kordiimonas sp. SCSIO 12603]UTW58234.1 hypothetical protein KFE96_15620 [Kordiimonas sp. SCSIO 12603]
MEGIIKQLIQKQEVVDVDTYNGDDTLVGILVTQSGDFVLLQRVAEEGLYDGGTIIELSNVFRVRAETNALKNQMQVLADQKLPSMPRIDFACWRGILQSLKESDNVVSIHCENVDSSMCWVGQVAAIIDDVVELRSFGTYDYPEIHRTYLNIDDITRIDLDRRYELGIYTFVMEALGEKKAR